MPETISRQTVNDPELPVVLWRSRRSQTSLYGQEQTNGVTAKI